MKTLPLALAFCFLAIAPTWASKIAERSLETLVAESDHVLVGTVTKVTLHTWLGIRRSNPEARTGPGSRNELRLHVRLDPAGVLKTNRSPLPKKLTLPLWKMSHLSLKDAREDEGKTYVFLLKGDDLKPVYPVGFKRDLSERAALEALVATPGPAAATETPATNH